MNEMSNRSYWDRLVALEKETETLVHRLYGNGHPGDIEKIVAQLEGLREQVGELRRANARLQGVVYVLGAIMPIALLVLQKILKI